MFGRPRSVPPRTRSGPHAGSSPTGAPVAASPRIRAAFNRTLGILALGILALLTGSSLAGCASPSSPSAASTAPNPSASASAVAAKRPRATASPAKPSASIAAAHAPEPANAAQVVSAKRALAVLFLEDTPAGAKACLQQDERDAAIECMLAIRYAKDKRAHADAVAIYRTAGWVAGLEHARTMDGGWRGMLKLVPELPVGHHRRHLAWLKHTATEMARFFEQLEKHSSEPPKYRWRGLELKFFRSVGRTTPSAYARSWSIAYNVSGSLHSSANAVRETMFHEIFHLNDDNWSNRALLDLHNTILKRCKKGKRLSTPCLTPYAPNKTMVRGGTYYAFEPGNGVWEYAAELAVRYNQEHRARWLNGPPKKPFKCGPKENARAWKAMVDSMFAGVDETPACP